MNPRLKPLAVLLPLAFVSPAKAAEEPGTTETIVVTASRSPMLLEHATGETVVIGKRDIEARKIDRLTDILSSTAGVFVAPGKGPLQNAPGVALRGIPSDRRALFLVDGIAMTDGYSGSVLLGGIPTESISQAEILFGPMSSLYGGNAMGGVINFVTRMPTRTEFGFETGYGTAFENGRAPADVVKTHVYAGSLLDNGLSFRISGNWAKTNGYRSEWVTGSRPAGTTGATPTTTETGAATYLLGTKGDNTWQEQGASIKLEQRIGNNTRWRAGWQLQEYEYGYDTPPHTQVTTTATGAPYYSSSYAGGDSRYSRQIFHAGFDTDLAGGHLNVLGSYTDVHANSFIIATTGATAFGGPGRINESPSNSTTFDSYWNTSLGNHDLTLGYAFRTDESDTRDYVLSNWSDPGSKTTLYSQAAGKTLLHGAYLQDNWQLLSNLTLQAGVRYDYWKNEDGKSVDSTGTSTHPARSESAISPKLGASWRVLDTLTLRTSAGRAFHAPTIYDLYRSSTLSTYDIKANPDLKPETVDSWELGADWQPWQGGEIRTTYFQNEISDLIYLGPRTPGPGGRDIRLRINAGKAVSNGITFGISQRLASATRIYANLTYTHSEMKENNASPNSVGKRLTNLPEKMANIGVEQRLGNWQLSVNGRYASKQYTDDANADIATNVYKAYDPYFVVDAKLNYRFDKTLDASLSVTNLFDRDYFSYYAAPGRAWFASLRYNY